LVVAAAKSGMNQDALRASFPRAAEIPFDSERKRMTTVHRLPQAEGQVDPALRLLWQWGGWDKLTQGEYIAFTKGAVDSLLEVSDRVWTRDGGIEPLTPAWRERIVGANARLAQNGMRVLGLAVRTDTALPVAGDMAYERELVLVGMVGMIDPARPEVKEAVRTCKQAGIRPIMITGDHPLTAGYIAAELGIETLEKVVTGQDLEAMSAAQLEEVVKRASVYARVSPEHKLRIVEALQRQGEVAAMTGDGVNDAPALKTADIGIAMGITGTDVSKEAADMVLLNDNFATIVAAVEEGRVIYDNIRRFVKYLTSCNSGEVAVMIFGPLLGMPLPLLPLQILWMNLVTDGLPALALGVEPAEKDVMQRDPHPPSEGIFARGLARDIIWMGLLMAALTLAVGYTAWRANNPDWQTLVFTILTFSQMALALAVRSENYSIFQIGLLSNKPLLGAIALTTLLQFAVIYFPPLQNLLETEPLTLAEMLLAIGVGVLMLTVVEVVKWMRRIRARSQGIAV
jgi:Ca2+-transporting ATPase